MPIISPTKSLKLALTMCFSLIVAMPAQAQQFTRTITDGQGLPEGSGTLTNPYQLECRKEEDRKCSGNNILRGCAKILENWRFITTEAFGESSETILPVYVLRVINYPRCATGVVRQPSPPIPLPTPPTPPTTERVPSCPSGFFVHSTGQGSGGITWLCMSTTEGAGLIITYGPGNNYKGIVHNY
jgi:hypothetical protein